MARVTNSDPYIDKWFKTCPSKFLITTYDDMFRKLNVYVSVGAESCRLLTDLISEHSDVSNVNVLLFMKAMLSER